MESHMELVNRNVEAIDYDELDPGIRDIVKMLREQGFETTDSGDGVAKFQQESKYYGCAPEPYPHVYCHTEPDDIVVEAEKLAEVLGDQWRVEATYWTRSHTAMLLAQKVTEAQLAADYYATERGR